jgi:hypothetical protein
MLCHIIPLPTFTLCIFYFDISASEENHTIIIHILSATFGNQNKQLFRTLARKAAELFEPGLRHDG